jgi:hypothetical protein
MDNNYHLFSMVTPRLSRASMGIHERFHQIEFFVGSRPVWRLDRNGKGDGQSSGHGGRGCALMGVGADILAGLRAPPFGDMRRA